MHDNVVRLPLNGGHRTLIDKEDWSRVAPFTWYVKRDRNGYLYVAATVADDACPRGLREVRLSRFILGVRDSRLVDHKNRDTLDNRRTNLRVATNAQNMGNQVRRRANKLSRFKGVSRIERLKANPWTAQIRTDGKLKHLGCFPEEEAAARAYDRAAKEVFGEFAALNFGANR